MIARDSKKVALLPMDSSFLNGIGSPQEILQLSQKLYRSIDSLPPEQSLSLTDMKSLGVFDLAHQYFVTMHSPYLCEPVDIGANFPWNIRHEVASTFIKAASRQSSDTDLIPELFLFCRKSVNKGYAMGAKNNPTSTKFTSKKSNRSDPIDNSERSTLFGSDLKHSAFKLSFIDGHNLGTFYPNFFSSKHTFFKGTTDLSFFDLLKLPAFTSEKIQKESSLSVLYSFVTNTSKSSTSLLDFYPYRNKLATFLHHYPASVFRPLFNQWADEIFTDFANGNFSSGKEKDRFLEGIAGKKYQQYISDDYAKDFLQRYLAQKSRTAKFSPVAEINTQIQRAKRINHRTPATLCYLSALKSLEQTPDLNTVLAKTLAKEKVNALA